MHNDFLIDLNDDLGTDSASSILTKEGSYRKSSIEHLYLYIQWILRFVTFSFPEKVQMFENIS